MSALKRVDSFRFYRTLTLIFVLVIPVIPTIMTTLLVWNNSWVWPAVAVDVFVLAAGGAAWINWDKRFFVGSPMQTIEWKAIERWPTAGWILSFVIHSISFWLTVSLIVITLVRWGTTERSLVEMCLLTGAMSFVGFFTIRVALLSVLQLTISYYREIILLVVLATAAWVPLLWSQQINLFDLGLVTVSAMLNFLILKIVIDKDDDIQVELGLAVMLASYIGIGSAIILNFPGHPVFLGLAEFCKLTFPLIGPSAIAIGLHLWKGNQRSKSFAIHTE